MEQFIKYVSQYKSDFCTCIYGASREEIARLEEVSGQTLPGFFRSFLQYMGHETCGIEIAHDGTAINDVLLYYEEMISTGYSCVPENCILIGLGDAKTCLQIKEEEEPRVILTDDEDILGLAAESLEKLLFQEAFAVYRSKEYPLDAFYSGNFVRIGERHRVAEARRIALNLGFEEQWFSGAITFCGERNDSCLFIHQGEKSGMSVIVRANHVETLSKVGKPFMDEIGVDLLL